MDVHDKDAPDVELGVDEISRFADSYESFNRVLGTLQRKYTELEQEFTSQNRELAEANRKLVELTARNIAATEFLNSLLNSITAGVIAIDTTGQITHFNMAAARIFDMQPEQLLGTYYRDRIPFGEPEHANVLYTFEKAVPLDSQERVISRADGVSLSLSVSTEILRDENGNPIGAVEVIHDVTKMKKMEQELTRLNTLAALGEMAATIAHEVRNPLSGIAGFATLLEHDLDPSDKRLKLVRKIIRGTEILNETITTLLNYTRFEETNKKETNWNEFISSTIAQFYRDNHEREKDIDIQYVNADKDSFSLMIDPVLCRQVFFNLFDNALAVCSGACHIEIRSRILPRKEALTHYSKQLLLNADETVVETTISDNGPGIPPEHLERIFAPFFTSRANGNGLGLAVVWKIIKAHGGEIIAENNPEGGAVFRVLLPVRMNAVNVEH